MIVLKIIGILFLVLLAIDVFLRIYYGRKALQLLMRMPPFRVEHVPPQKQATPFSAVTKDGLTLRGSIYHPDEETPQGVVIYCPETLATHWSAVRYCQSLMDAGFIVVSFDFRNQGESDSLPGYDSIHWMTEHEITDLNTIIDWVFDQESLSSLPLGLFGVSRGGGVALITAARRREIIYVASDSGFTNDQMLWHHLDRWSRVVVPKILFKIIPSIWHMKITLDLAIWFYQFKNNCRYVNASRPFARMRGKHVLLIAGVHDTYVPIGVNEKIAAMLGNQCDELWKPEKAGHNLAHVKYPELYKEKLVSFFQQMTPESSEADRPEVSPRNAASLASRV